MGFCAVSNLQSEDEIFKKDANSSSLATTSSVILWVIRVNGIEHWSAKKVPVQSCFGADDQMLGPTA